MHEDASQPTDPAARAVPDLRAEAARLWAGGHKPEAVAFLEAALRTRPDAAGLNLDLGLYRLARGDADSALACLQIVLAQMPGHARALRAAIDATLALGKLDLAKDLCDHAATLPPDDDLLLIARARVLLRTDEPAAAARVLDGISAARLGPADAILHAVLCARAQTRTGQPDAAEATLSAALSVRPGQPDLLLEQVELALATGDMARARDRLAALPPDIAQKDAARRMQARLTAASGLTAAAPEPSPLAAGDIVTLLKRGREQAECGEHQGAERDFARVLQHDPTHRGAILRRIDAVMALGDMRLAASLCDAAAGILGQDDGLLARKARVLHTTGMSRSALNLLQAALDQRRDAEFILVDVLIDVLTTLGDWTGAEQALDHVLERDPGHVAAWNRRINVAQAQGDWDEALALSRRALDRTGGALPLILRQAELLAGILRHRDALEGLDTLPDAVAHAPQTVALRARLLAELDTAGDLSR